MNLNGKNKKWLSKSLLALSVMALSLFGTESYAFGNKTGGDHFNRDHTKLERRDSVYLAMNQTRKKALKPTTKRSVLSALKANETLHAAFFKYDAKAVEEKAIKLNKAISAIRDRDIAKLLKFSKAKLSQIKASNGRKANNKNYNLVSMAFIHIISKYDVGSDYSAYYCPMAKMKWVQNTSKTAQVQNPYMPKMPRCGKQV